MLAKRATAIDLLCPRVEEWGHCRFSVMLAKSATAIDLLFPSSYQSAVQ